MLILIKLKYLNDGMRIGFVLSHCHHYGSSKYILELSKYFHKWGYEIHVFANTCDKTTFLRFHKIPVPTSHFFFSNSWITFFETFYLKFWNLDITIAQPGRYLVPDICHVRFLTGSFAKIKKVSPFYGKFLARLEEYSLKRCKRIVVMSEFMKREVMKRGISEEKIDVIYDGVDVRIYHSRNRERVRKRIRQLYGISEDETLLLFVGNPFRRKGLMYAIKALESLRGIPVKLMVVGKSLTHDNINFYLNLASRIGVEKMVIYVGLIKDVYKYFAASDIFILPTLYEPFGLVILEAMASGLPVIVSSKECCGAAELIENGKNGILLDNPKNWKELAEKILYLISNEKERRKIGKFARKKVKCLSWKFSARGWIDVFQKV